MVITRCADFEVCLRTSRIYSTMLARLPACRGRDVSKFVQLGFHEKPRYFPCNRQMTSIGIQIVPQQWHFSFTTRACAWLVQAGLRRETQRWFGPSRHVGSGSPENDYGLHDVHVHLRRCVWVQPRRTSLQARTCSTYSLHFQSDLNLLVLHGPRAWHACFVSARLMY